MGSYRNDPPLRRHGRRGPSCSTDPGEQQQQQNIITKRSGRREGGVGRSGEVRERGMRWNETFSKHKLFALLY